MNKESICGLVRDLKGQLKVTSIRLETYNSRKDSFEISVSQLTVCVNKVSECLSSVPPVTDPQNFESGIVSTPPSNNHLAQMRTNAVKN